MIKESWTFTKEEDAWTSIRHKKKRIVPNVEKAVEYSNETTFQNENNSNINVVIDDKL